MGGGTQYRYFFLKILITILIDNVKINIEDIENIAHHYFLVSATFEV